MPPRGSVWLPFPAAALPTFFWGSTRLTPCACARALHTPIPASTTFTSRTPARQRRPNGRGRATLARSSKKAGKSLIGWEFVRRQFSWPLLPPPAPQASFQAPFARGDEGPTTALGVALVHCHPAQASSCRPADGKGRGLRQAVGCGSEGEGGDYGARTRSEWMRRLVTWGASRQPWGESGRVQGVGSAPRAPRSKGWGGDRHSQTQPWPLLCRPCLAAQLPTSMDLNCPVRN